MEEGGYGSAFRRHFLLPITSAVWSTGATRAVDFPIDYLLRFLDHHGLIGVGDALPWLTIPGGSRTYVERILATLPSGAVRTGDPVVDVARRPDHVRIRTASGGDERFDAVVLAVHADDALTLLHDADAAERTALDGFSYSANQVVLHTDTGLMPRQRRAWASWNVEQDDCASPGDLVAMTYHMNRLQQLPGMVDYLVSVNSGIGYALSASSSSARCATRCTRSGRSRRRPPSAGSRVTDGPFTPERTCTTGSTRTGAGPASRRQR